LSRRISDWFPSWSSSRGAVYKLGGRDPVAGEVWVDKEVLVVFAASWVAERNAARVRRKGSRERAGGGIQKEKCPSDFGESLGRPRREQDLPWDIFNILATGAVRLAVVDLAAVSVCAKDVGRLSRPDAGISGTANVLRANSWYVVGTLPSAKHNVASDPKFARHMRPPSAEDEPAAAKKLAAGRTVRRNAVVSRRWPIPSLPAVTMIRIRGHAAENLLVLFATGLAATKRCVRLAVARLVTAVTIAARIYGVRWIVNVSGWLATAQRDDSSVSSNIRPGVVRGGLAPHSVVE